MSHVSGVGGAFIFSANPKKLADWYAEHFGFVFEGSEEFGAFYQVFRAIDPGNPGALLDTTFAIMRAKVDLPRASGEIDDDDIHDRILGPAVGHSISRAHDYRVRDRKGRLREPPPERGS